MSMCYMYVHHLQTDTSNVVGCLKAKQSNCLRLRNSAATNMSNFRAMASLERGGREKSVSAEFLLLLLPFPSSFSLFLALLRFREIGLKCWCCQEHVSSRPIIAKFSANFFANKYSYYEIFLFPGRNTRRESIKSLGISARRFWIVKEGHYPTNRLCPGILTANSGLVRKMEEKMVG